MLSPSGSLVYVPARTAASVQQLVWVERNGEEEPLPFEPGSYRIPRLAPDGSRLVYDDCCHQAEPPVGDLWIYDLASRNANRLTFDTVSQVHPAWTPDGTHVAFFSIDHPARPSGSIRSKAAAGTGDAQLRIESINPVPQAFSPDGQFLIYSDARDI